MTTGTRTPTSADEYLAYKQRFNNWGRWGDSDQHGTLNHITDETRRDAIALVTNGRTISLSNPLATEKVHSGPRNSRPADHQMNVGASASMDYIGVSYHGFINTHIDALCHVFTGDNGKLYNGFDSKLVTEDGAAANSIDRWRDGIVTRAVLYDIPKLRGTDYVALDEPVEAWHLRQWADQNLITPCPGDAVLIRSGADPFYAANPDHQFVGIPPNTPGVAVSVLEYLYETDAALLGWDLQEAAGQEHLPARIPLHEVAIPHMGMPLLDNANFERLSQTCEQNNRYEFMLTIAPLVVLGGTGSPVNPIATL